MSSCSGCVTRREFLSASTAAAVTAVLAACGSDGGPTGTSSATVEVRLSDYPALATVGGIARISGTSTPMAVVRADAGSYRAFSLVCPHERATVGIQGTGFKCPLHGATFNASGSWTGGERTTGLKELRVTANAAAGTLTITG